MIRHSSERDARRRLEAAGLSLMDANFSCRQGEIDLIMRDGNTIAMIEVRQRRGGNVVDALASVSAAKRRRLTAAARYWLSRHPHLADHPVRFDVYAVDGEHEQWLRDAFQIDG